MFLLFFLMLNCFLFLEGRDPLYLVFLIQFFLIIRPVLLYKLNQPFLVTDTLNEYDVKVNVYGGGITGQAEAIRLGIARALEKINPEFRALMKPEKLLTRDPRMVERKKYGQKKARKKFQFSKR